MHWSQHSERLYEPPHTQYKTKRMLVRAGKPLWMSDTAWKTEPRAQSQLWENDAPESNFFSIMLQLVIEVFLLLRGFV